MSSIAELEKAYDCQRLGNEIIVHKGRKNVVAATRVPGGDWVVHPDFEIELGTRSKPAPKKKAAAKKKTAVKKAAAVATEHQADFVESLDFSD